jgi:NAD+ diphosphatase
VTTSIRPPIFSELALSRAEVDRLAELRGDLDLMDALLNDATTRILAVFRAEAPVAAHDEEAALIFTPLSDFEDLTEFAFLGKDADGIAYFAGFVTEDFANTSHVGQWKNLRSVGAELGARDAGLLVSAVALANWHSTHQRCPRCGVETIIAEAGWTRKCPDDGSTHFPRTDPAIIVMVTDHQDRALLARQARWQPGWLSVLAGFVEAGESTEAAVVREVGEESGVILDPLTVEYLASQPWPFPNSLMMGYRARVSSRYGSDEDIPLTVDGVEIAHAQWMSREELLKACQVGEIHLPPKVSIAHRLIVDWLGQPLPRETSFR